MKLDGSEGEQTGEHPHELDGSEVVEPVEHLSKMEPLGLRRTDIVKA